jgi:hypothetical protein
MTSSEQVARPAVVWQINQTKLDLTKLVNPSVVAGRSPATWWKQVSELVEEQLINIRRTISERRNDILNSHYKKPGYIPN